MTSAEGAYALNNLIVVLLSDKKASKVYNRQADAVPDAITVLPDYATPYQVMALSSVIG